MSDWRLNEQEEYLSNKTVYEITFPAFWEAAYKDKNIFFQIIERYAKKHVETANRGHEFLEGEKIQHFWHAHCEFCWEKALTDKACVFYCTEDMYHWICEECFHDFREVWVAGEICGRFIPLINREVMLWYRESLENSLTVSAV